MIVAMMGFIWYWPLDGWIVATGILCAVSASLLGNFLVLRRMSMLGDAISHAVLPGLAAAFIITNSRSSLPMFLGAVVVGVLTALLTEWIRGYGQVDEGAAMGVVFTSLFAIGLILIVQVADHVDLDPGCVLYGSIETAHEHLWDIVGFKLPRVVITLSVVLLINLTFIALFYKELKISTFDPGLASSSGFHAGVMHYLLTILVAITAVASFESVGNILVVAMFVVPPATAYMLTDRLAPMIVISAVVAAMSAVLGHVSAITIPRWFGYDSVLTTGMMAVSVGFFFLLAATFSPKHGIIVRLVRRRMLSLSILAEDLIAWLYRVKEQARSAETSFSGICGALAADRWSTWFVLRRQMFRGLVQRTDNGFELTSLGRSQAQSIVRSHRLWEHYLVREAGFSVDHIHNQAERLEHFTNQGLRDRLSAETEGPTTDPHGQMIPPETKK